MKVACFLLTVLPVVVGQTCPTRPVTDPYQDIYTARLAPDREVKCCELRISPTDPLKPGPPRNGDSCTNAFKTCLFGSQTCPDGSIHPTERSDCDGSQYTTSPVDCPLCPGVDACCGSLNQGPICGISMEDTGPGLPPGPFDSIGDEGVPNVVVSLFDESGVVIASTLTDTNGCFIFEDVPRGPYAVGKNDLPNFMGITGPMVALVDSFHHTAREVCFLDYLL